MNVGFKTRLYIGFALAILLSAVSGLTSYHIFTKQATQRLWVKRARYALDSVRNIQGMMSDMETGRRGFRATNEKRFLEPYNAAIPHIRPAISGLKDLLSDDPEQENRAMLLSQRIDSLISFWENKSDDANRYNSDAVIKIARETVPGDPNALIQLASEEKRQMDGIRAIISDLQKDENKLLIQRREEYDTLIRDSTLSATIDSILCELIIIILIFFIFREFNKRRKTQEQLNSTVEELRAQADVLQASQEELKNALAEVETINGQLEKFVYTVAHDIKSPLAGISGSLSILEGDETIAANPILSQFVNLSYEQSIHLSEMVNSILEYSRVSLGQQQVDKVNTKELAEEIAILMFPPKNIRIVVADNMPVFTTKRIKIMEVFQNLIGNAIKYNDKESGLIEVGCREKEAYYEFYVRDNGRGIPAENVPHIFSLFRESGNKPQRETSTGFGLNIVKLIIEEQGGKIWVTSEPGAGSTFYFEWKK